MGASISASHRDVVGARDAAEAAGRYMYFLRSVGLLLHGCLQDTSRDALGMLEHRLAVVIGNRFMLPETGFVRIRVLIDVRVRPMLLVQWDGKQRGDPKVERLEEIVVIGVEKQAGLGQFVGKKFLRGAADIGRAHMSRFQYVDHAGFFEYERVAKTCLIILEQLEHFLLRQWREQ